jgi:putative membrane protein
MKRINNYLTHLPRAVGVGAAMVLAVTSAQAQSSSPTAPSAAAQPVAGVVSHRGKELLKDASQGNLTEIAMGNIAESKSANTQVKDLARMIVTDHQQNQSQVQALAQTYGVTLDTAPDWMNKREIDRLQKANDAEFDKEFTKCMLKDHVKAIKRFEKAATEIQEQDLKQYAMNTLPALRHHLQKSEEAARSAGVEDSTINSILKDLPAGGQAVSSR